MDLSAYEASLDTSGTSEYGETYEQMRTRVESLGRDCDTPGEYHWEVRECQAILAEPGKNRAARWYALIRMQYLLAHPPKGASRGPITSSRASGVNYTPEIIARIDRSKSGNARYVGAPMGRGGNGYSRHAHSTPWKGSSAQPMPTPTSAPTEPTPAAPIAPQRPQHLTDADAITIANLLGLG